MKGLFPFVISLPYDKELIEFLKEIGEEYKMETFDISKKPRVDFSKLNIRRYNLFERMGER